jgi:alkylation response protein AidB-like acyl-CoA dehydrogenase
VTTQVGEPFAGGRADVTTVLRLSDERRALVETFAQFAARSSPVARARQAEPLGFDPVVWADLAKVDGLGLSVPPAAGGSGAGLVEAALLGIELGAVLAPVPYAEAVAAARLLARVEGCEEVLAAVLGEDELATFFPTALAADRPALCPTAAVSTVVLVAWRGTTWRLCPGRGTLQENLGGLPAALLDPARAVPVALGADAGQWDRARRDWQVLAAAQLAGLGGGALALGVEYAKNRVQFGVPIGSFQSLNHRFADASTLVTGARLLVLEAAWAVDRADPRAAELAPMALYLAARAAEEAATHSLHVHGGYGFSLEYDIQLYYRRAKGWPLAYTTRRELLAEIADARFGRAER